MPRLRNFEVAPGPLTGRLLLPRLFRVAQVELPGTTRL